MALIKCPECGKQVSDKAQACVGCGYPISEMVIGNSNKNTTPVTNTYNTSNVEKKQMTQASSSSTYTKGSSSSGGGCLMVILVIIIVVVLLGSCGGESQYEKDSRSGFDKWTSGDFDSMTDGEKKAVNDFLEWANEN